MRFSLNIRTHPGDLAIIGHDWQNTLTILATEGFDGYELYPVGEHEWKAIPPGLMQGLHLRFYPILKPFWVEDNRRLLEIFGNKETIAAFYGGLTPESLVANYRKQFSLARQLGCAYAVFHLAQSEFDYIYNWRFPWEWHDTINISTELLNAVLADSPFTGELLLENLWWQGSFRALDSKEIGYALTRIAYLRTGIILDTGHMLNTNQSILSEAQGIAFLINSVQSLGEMSRAIRGVHLTRSLSAEYVVHSRTRPTPSPAKGYRYRQAIDHVNRIDQQDPFEDRAIADLFEVINPTYVTYEFTYASREEWLSKIRRQHKAMADIHCNTMGV
jgi:hypothetical protein